MTTATLTSDWQRAIAAAAAFNQQTGREWLIVQAPDEAVTPTELAELALRAPGEYCAANLFRAVRARAPSHAETVKLGQLLGRLAVARRKAGPVTYWRLDKAFADRVA